MIRYFLQYKIVSLEHDDLETKDWFFSVVWPKLEQTLIEFKDLDDWQQMNNCALGKKRQQEASDFYDMPILEKISCTPFLEKISRTFQNQDLGKLTNQLKEDAFRAFQTGCFDCFDDKDQRVRFLEGWLKNQHIYDPVLNFSDNGASRV